MIRYQVIKNSLEGDLRPVYLEIVDESDKHAGRQGMESHFKLWIVSDEFENLSRVQRHQRVQKVLSNEFQKGLHAITLKAQTPKEWELSKAQSLSFQSPECGGKKYEK